MLNKDDLELLRQIVARGVLTINGEQARLIGRLLDKIERLLKEEEKHEKDGGQEAEVRPEPVEGPRHHDKPGSP